MGVWRLSKMRVIKRHRWTDMPWQSSAWSWLMECSCSIDASFSNEAVELHPTFPSLFGSIDFMDLYGSLWEIVSLTADHLQRFVRPASDAVPGPMGRIVRCHFDHGDFQAGQLVRLVSWFPKSMVWKMVSPVQLSTFKIGIFHEIK